MGCRCGASTERVTFGDRRVEACSACHLVTWADTAPVRSYGMRHHMRCLQEEIREAEKEQDDERQLTIRVQRKESDDLGRPLFTGQVEEGDPRWVQKGSVVEGTLARHRRGFEKNVEVKVLRRHKEAVRIVADAPGWQRVEVGERLLLVPRSSAQVQRTLLQAYLLANKVNDNLDGLEDPARLPRIPRTPPEGLTLDGLRPSQARAVQAALGLPDDGLLLVQGPPGTGKTTVIASMVRNAVRMGLSVLIASHTHVAVDNAMRRLLRANPLLAPKMARIGDASVVATDLGGLVSTLGQFLDDPEDPDARPLWRCIYEKRPIVGMTLDALASGLVRHREHPFEPFDLCIVDEAAMNLFPKLALARSASRRLVLVGDHQQLPPIVTAPSFRNDASYRRSPFETLQALRGDLLVLLDEQFRCHPDLYEWSADAIYGGAIASRKPASPGVPDLLGRPLQGPVVWVDTSRVPGAEDERVGSSRMNRIHVAVAARIIEELVRDHGFSAEDIGYISPFRTQARFYTESVRRLLLHDADVLASTVDAFQGDERKAIIYDLTSSGPAKPHEDPRRLNVSLTRAQDLLVIVGRRDFVTSPRQNPWLWSLQHWDKVQHIKASEHLVPRPVADALARFPVPDSRRPVAKPATS